MNNVFRNAAKEKVLSAMKPELQQYKMSPKILMLSLAIVGQILTASQVHAQYDEGSSLKAANQSEKSSVETPIENQAVVKDQDKNHLGEILKEPYFVESFTKIHQEALTHWNEISAMAKEQVANELNRYKMNLVIGLDNKGFQAAKIDFGADVFYELAVEPSFQAGKQVRQDIYVVGLRASKLITAGAQARITFFREFDSKSEAIFSTKPYGLDKIPKNTEDLKKLADRDGVRVEVLGNFGVQDSLSSLTEKSKVGLSGSFGREAVFLLDIYKHDERTVRARFIGTINRGIGRLQAELIAAGNVVGWLPSKLKELLEIGFTFGLQKTFEINDEYPIETQMVDYTFKFAAGDKGDPSQKTAAMAFDEVLKNMKGGGFLDVFNPNLTDQELADRLKEKASIAYELTRADATKVADQQRVTSNFQGRMSSNLTAGSFGQNFSRLLRHNSERGSSSNFVTSIDASDKKEYFLLSNAYTREKTTKFFGRSESEINTDLDALIHSNHNKKVGGLIDMVNRIVIRDRSLSSGELVSFREGLRQSIPANVLDRDKILGAIPTEDQKLSLINFQYSMAPEAIGVINRFSVAELEERLTTFIDNHPQGYLMVSNSATEVYPNRPAQVYIHNLAVQIKASIEPLSNNEKRYNALKALMKDPNFAKYIVNEFVTSLLTSDEVDRLLNLKLYLSTSTISDRRVSIGKNVVSKVYDAVLAMRSIIGDRSLDLRLETVSNPDGTKALEATNIRQYKPKM